MQKIESACRGLGQVYWNLGNLKEAIEKHERCFKICKELGEKSRQRSAYLSLGQTYLLLLRS